MWHKRDEHTDTETRRENVTKREIRDKSTPEAQKGKIRDSICVVC